MTSLSTATSLALKQNMGLKKTEKVLIVYDDNKTNIATTFFAEAQKITKKVKLLKIPIGKVSGEEPPTATAEEMLNYDIILLITTRSLSHTQARKNASKNGARIASLPGITKDIMVRTLNADYTKIANLSKKISNYLKGKKITITKEWNFPCPMPKA